MALHVFGIPNCGTVRKARNWMDERDVNYTFTNFRADSPSLSQVAHWVEALGAKAMRNTSGGSYRALPVEKTDWDVARWTQEFAADPMLIKRPLIERDGVPVLVRFRASDELLTQWLIA